MTSQELAIVQGPPGTGKTFTSLVALESLVKAFASQPLSGHVPPIIVSAQTNHALDQLLSGCVKRSDVAVARMGGQSKDEFMEERTLYNIQSSLKDRGVFLPSGVGRAEKSRNWHIKQFKELVEVAFPSGLVSAQQLKTHGIITEEQYSSLSNDEWESLPTTSTLASNSSSKTTSPNKSHRNRSSRRPPVAGGNSPVKSTKETSEQEEDLLDRWLVGFVERDMTCDYVPPTDQLEPTIPLTRDWQAEQGDRRAEGDEKEQLKGTFVPIELNFTGSVAGGTRGNVWITKAARLLRDNDDLYDVKPPQRGLVYRYLRHQLVAKLSKEASQIFIQHQKACELVKIEKWTHDVKVLQHEKIRIIGCTTTGLTKYRGLLAALKPKILLIEEAAETREPHVTSALFPTLQQLILVGDHQQLMPHVDVRELGRDPYNLHVSLFERLVNLGLPFSQLRVQRRMIPAIGKLLRAFYPDVEDHATVKDDHWRTFCRKPSGNRRQKYEPNLPG